MHSAVTHLHAYPMALDARSVSGVLRNLESLSKADKSLAEMNCDYFGNSIERYRVEGGIGIIPLKGIVSKGLGPLGEYFGYLDLAKFGAALRQAIDDPAVKAIALDIASPGGSVLGTASAAALVAEAAEKKPVMAYTDDLMASAAYYIAAGATHIFAGPGAIVGSVGVYTVFVDARENYEMQGIKALVIRSGDKKAIGAYGLDPADEENIGKVQADIDALGAEFRAWVQAYRVIDDTDLDGQTFTGSRALQHNFIDGVATTFGDALSHYKS